MTVAGIDFSTHAVDIVLLDEDSDQATWHRFELSGRDAFERARCVNAAVPAGVFWDDVLCVGIEDPRGYGAGSLYRIQGAILSRIPTMKLVYPWIPGQWRKAVGLPGNCPKDDVGTWALHALADATGIVHLHWPQDALDAYCIALATRTALHREEAA